MPQEDGMTTHLALLLIVGAGFVTYLLLMWAEKGR